MKANELMIGDWVSIGENYIRVTSLKEGEEYLEAKPIPITEEILEKNGFEKQGFPGWLIYTKEYMIQWRNDYPNVLSIDSFSSNYGSFFRSHVDYVHELQHALRLCGIDMEIVL